MPQASFNLRLWFALGSLGTIMLITAVGALLLTQSMTAHLLEREGKVSQEFLEAIVKVNGAETFLDAGPQDNAANPMLLDFANHLVSMPGVVRANVHAPTRRVLWSTENRIVGQVFSGNDELEEAFSDRIVTELSQLEGDLKAEHVALGQSGSVIESYIPIHAESGKGSVLGVVEFYRLPLSLDRTLRRVHREIWAGAALAALVLFAMLYWIVQKGARLIEGQQQDIARMEALAAIGQMSGAVAHSLRNPMSAIRSSAELWRPQLPPEGRETADEIIGEVDRMDRYVRDLLAYARSDKYQLQPVDGPAVVQTVLDLQRPATERHGIAVSVSLQEAAGLSLMADARLLEQALTSVVTNAIEAMPDGGSLTVSLSSGGGRVRIAVTDTGRGIPSEILEKVSQSYFTTKSRGLGLGLVLARRIIERFGGETILESAPGQGTTVTLDLRAA
ncbi:MAG: ATP-binding protein [Alsobacter sp.]